MPQKMPAFLEWLETTVYANKMDDYDARTLADDALVLYEFGYGGENVSCGLLPPAWELYWQMVVTVVVQSLLNAILAVGMYKLVVEPQRGKQQRKRPGNDNDNNPALPPSTSSTTSILFALGIAMPVVLLEPIYAIQQLRIRNAGLIMVFLATPINNTLRILEGLAGFCPESPASSLSNYVVYFSCCFGVDFDDEKRIPKTTTPRFLVRQISVLAREFFFTTVVLSILKPTGYRLLLGRAAAAPEVDAMDLAPGELFSWKHLVDNFMVALLISVSLSQASLGLSILYNLAYGVQTYKLMQNPMFRSKSPSDFWGCRWNVLVHNGLKRGVYKPVRARNSRAWAVAATFVVSGLIHEYVNAVMFGGYGGGGDGGFGGGEDDETAYRFRWKQLLFFGWNGVLVGAERAVGHWSIFRWISENLPRVLVTALVISSALPLAHLFTGDWIRGGYFDAISILEFVVACETKAAATTSTAT